MIKTQNLTPEIYYNRSRDFQTLGRVYDVIFNYMKNNADLINNAPFSDNFDTNFVDLVSTTLGFKESHSYNIDELKALCSVFALAIRNKGNISSINLILNMLTNVYNSNTTCYAEMSTDDRNVLRVFIPENITNTTIFKDVLNYILPAGIVCDVISQEAVKQIMETVIPFDDTSVTVTPHEYNAVQTSSVFAPIQDTEELSKYFGKLTNTTVLRVGDANDQAEDLNALEEAKNKYKPANGSGD